MKTNIENRTLIIPQELVEYKEVSSLFEYDNNSTILYKKFNDNIVNLEFYTHLPCIVFNCNGTETITSYDFKSVDIQSNELLFLPQGMHLISDFKKNNESLEAYLFFFDDDLINEFLSIKKCKHNQIQSNATFFKMNVSSSILEYISVLSSVCNKQFYSKEFLKLKLLEFLYLIDSIDTRLLESLLLRNKQNNKRNIISLMKKYFLSNFTLEDYAKLSGRSLSTFNRDFKNHTHMTPKQYLLKLKLEYAKETLQNSHKSVTQVASDIGYENTSHFIKAFTNKYHITPKQLSKNSL